MVAARNNPHLNSFRDKLVAAGKSKLVALIAVTRKLTTILNASFEIDAHGSQSQLEQRDSRSLLYPAKSVSRVLTLETRFLSSDRSVWDIAQLYQKFSSCYYCTCLLTITCSRTAGFFAVCYRPQFLVLLRLLD